MLGNEWIKADDLSDTHGRDIPEVSLGLWLLAEEDSSEREPSLVDRERCLERVANQNAPIRNVMAQLVVVFRITDQDLPPFSAELVLIFVL